MRSENVKHLVIVDSTLRGDALDWVRAVCRHHDVQVHRYVRFSERYLPFLLAAAALLVAEWCFRATRWGRVP